MTTPVVNIRQMAMGKRLKELREARNLSQPKVESDLGGVVSQSALSALESRDFSGLTFYRVKQRAQTHIQIEFNEVVYRDADGHLVVHDLGRDDG